MITVVSLNPSIDKTVLIDSFQVGGLNRVVSSRNDAGGKGVNCACVIGHLGYEVGCIGFMYHDDRTMFYEKLKDNGSVYEFVEIPGKVRVNMKLNDRVAGVVTEINESGAEISPDKLAEMTELFRKYARMSQYVILTGSLPKGVSKDYYRELIEIAKETGVKCVLDADGEMLRLGLRAKPYLIKPNRYELETLTGRTLDTLADIAKAARDLVAGGVGICAVSMGGDGAMITDGVRTLYAPRMQVDVKSTVGAGDSMVAGLTVGLEASGSMEYAFRTGVACASAAVMTEGTQVFRRAEYMELIDKIHVEALA